MKQIPLTQGQVALVDDEDFEFLNQWKWCAHRKNSGYYAVRNSSKGSPRKTIIMARLIMNTPDGFVCDHIDHNTLNYQKYNLRNITNAQNEMNRKGAQRNNILGILGISQKRGGFFARIKINGKQIPFPVRNTIEEAKADREAAEIKYFGDYRGNK